MNAYETNTYQHAGHTIRVEWHYDQDTGAPWDEEYGHSHVSSWTKRDKRPGELVLNSDRGSYRFYDYAEAIKIAKRDAWDAKPYNTGTKGQRAERAVRADFELLRRWCNNEWHWCGYVCEIDGTDYSESLWGINSDSQCEFEKEAIAQAKSWLDRELTESNRAACADIATV